MRFWSQVLSACLCFWGLLGLSVGFCNIILHSLSPISSGSSAISPPSTDLLILSVACFLGALAFFKVFEKEN
jgi:hypothetical protein